MKSAPSLPATEERPTRHARRMTVSLSRSPALLAALCALCLGVPCVPFVPFVPTAHAASATRTSAFEYDPATGLLTQEIIEPDNPQQCLATTYTYDNFGNKTSATTASCSGANADTQIVSRTSDSWCQDQSMRCFRRDSRPVVLLPGARIIVEAGHLQAEGRVLLRVALALIWRVERVRGYSGWL
jgi:hypothetical protein